MAETNNRRMETDSMKITIAIVCALVGTLAYFAATAPSINKENENGSFYRVRIPIPNGGGINTDRDKQTMEQIVKTSDLPSFIVGNQVVLTKRDQQVLSHAQMRRIYGMHE